MGGATDGEFSPTAEQVYREREEAQKHAREVQAEQERIERETAQRATERAARQKATDELPALQQAATEAIGRLKNANWPNGHNCVGMKDIVTGYKQRHTWYLKKYYTQRYEQYVCWEVGETLFIRGIRSVSTVLLASNGKLYMSDTFSPEGQCDRNGIRWLGNHKLTAEIIFKFSQSQHTLLNYEAVLHNLQQLGR